ncbi:hypothetical protein L6R53_01625 [Myxococcota bacterium]|nr:hypothetical protein [Myxococcota bacterium]
MSPILLALALTGCTFQPGTAFGRLDAFSADLSFDAGAARDLGDGVVLTDQGDHVALAALSVVVSTVELQELQGAGGVTFDPANPPEGYGLCHGGHCHAEDGSLVGYDEIIAELSGGSAQYVGIVSAALDLEIDLLAGGPGDLGLQGALLPQAELTRLAVVATTLRGQAQVTGDALLAPLELSWELPFEGWSTTVDAPVDRDQPEGLSVETAVVIDGSLFDGTAWADLGLEPVHLDDAQDGGPGQRLVEQALATFPTTTVSRSD